MKRVIILIIAAAAAFALFYGVRHFTGPKEAAAAPELCHLFNEGFSVRAGETTVLMDAFVREGYPEDQMPPPGLTEGLERALPPLYDGVDLITVSHAHADHFSAAAVAAHMRANPKAEAVLPDEAAAALIAEAGGDFAGRIHGLYPERGKPETVTAGGIDLTIYNLDHRTEVQNIGILFALGGKTFFHAGDFMSADFGENGVAGIKVDYLLIPYWYYLDPADREQYLTKIAADYIVPMHIPRRGAELAFIEERGGWDAVMQSIRDLSPKILWLYEPGACVRAVAPGGRN